MKNTDLGTTIIGGIIAAATAAQPVINSAQGNFGTQDIISLVTAVLFAVFGFFSNKQPKNIIP